MPSIHRRKLDMGSTTNNLLLSCLCSYLGAVSFGFVIGFSSPAVPLMVKSGILDDNTASWFSSVVNLGALLGCFLAGWLVEKIGRKTSLLFTSAPFISGCAFIYLGDSSAVLCLGRMLSGMGCGMCTVVCPLYIAEISPKEVRGMLGSGVQLSITVGILLAYLVGGMVSWQNLAAFGLVIPILSAALALRSPDSPRFLINKGSTSEATRVLKWLRPSTADVSEEIQDMENSGKEQNIGILEIFKHANLVQPLVASAGVLLFQQLIGINVVMFYTVSIFESAGFEDGNTATVWVGLVQVIMTIVACLLMDRAGRRVLLVISGFGMAASCLTLGYYYHHNATDPTGNLSWLALASVIGYIIFFSIGWGPIPMLIMSEIFPSHARGAASSLATLTSWSSSFLITKQFIFMQNALGMHGSFVLFGVCCILGILFVLRKVPETKGRSLEEIEQIFLQQRTRGI